MALDFLKGIFNRPVEAQPKRETETRPFIAAEATVQSPDHAENEDSSLADVEHKLVVVADGTSGGGKGRGSKELSRMIAKRWEELAPGLDRDAQAALQDRFVIRSLDTRISAIMDVAFRDVVSRAYELSQAMKKSGALAGTTEAKAPYSTLIVAKVYETAEGKYHAVVKSVGDSKGFILRGDGRIDRIPVQEEVKEGGLVMRHLGTKPSEVKIHSMTVTDLKPGDVLMLTSDGTDPLSILDMEDAARLGATTQEKVEKIVKAARAAGGRDDITVSALEVPGAPERKGEMPLVEAGFKEDVKYLQSRVKQMEVAVRAARFGKTGEDADTRLAGAKLNEARAELAYAEARQALFEAKREARRDPSPAAEARVKEMEGQVGEAAAARSEAKGAAAQRFQEFKSESAGRDEAKIVDVRKRLDAIAKKPERGGQNAAK
jgi:serine/threonine protein phosphatase PrpC